MLQVFIDKAQLHLIEIFEEKLKDNTGPEIREMILQGIEHAGAYDITDEPEVILFIDLTVAMGPDFEAQKGNEWMRPILEKKNLGQKEKMEFIYMLLEERTPE